MKLFLVIGKPQNPLSISMQTLSIQFEPSSESFLNYAKIYAIKKCRYKEFYNLPFSGISFRATNKDLSFELQLSYF